MRTGKKTGSWLRGPLPLLLSLWGLIFVRYCYYGLQYYPQLDDYIQYHNYAAYHPDFWALAEKLGLFAARPLAGTLDILFWSKFFPVMILGVLLISLLHAASGWLFRWVWSRHFGTGTLFLVVYALLPLGMEGTYWMSAATRVVVSLFGVSVAMAAFQMWCEKGRWPWLALALLSQLLSFGFYEQGMVLGITGVLLVALLQLRGRWKRALWGLWTFVNVGLFGLFTRMFQNSALYGSRVKLMLPGDPAYWESFWPAITVQVKTAFWDGFWATLLRGGKRGLAVLLQDGNWLYMAAVLVLCGLFVWAALREKNQPQKPALALLVGFLMALAPVTPFFVLANPWFSLRGTVPSFCGLALMADTLWNLLVCWVPAGRGITAGVCGAAAVCCCVASISELHDYRATWQMDQKIATAICDELDNGKGYEKSQRIGILGIRDSYLEEQNLYYHEHIHGVTESYWALTGASACLSGNGQFPVVVPLPLEEVLYSYEQDFYRLSTFYELYYYDGETLSPLTMEQTGEESFRLYRPGGELFATTWEQDGVGHLEPAP